ncbi:MAG: NAD(+)/NADH kinase [Nitrospinota bacterium]
MKKIGVIVKSQHPMSKKALQGLRDWLVDRGIEVIIDQETAKTIDVSSSKSKEDVASQSDLIVVMGGDGTLLAAARLLEDRDIPILGVNFGGLGFLTDITFEELYPALEMILAGDYKTEGRIKIDIALIRKGEVVDTHIGLNDVVINRGHLARILNLKISVDDLFVTNYRADGLIISTPTGSTAYSLAAAGPIVYPTTEALVLAPICPHNLTNRPIVLPDSVKIEATLATVEEDVMVTIDGQIGFPLYHGDVIRVKKSLSKTSIIQSPRKDYYQVLREKLGWGGQIGKY